VSHTPAKQKQKEKREKKKRKNKRGALKDLAVFVKVLL